MCSCACLSVCGTSAESCLENSRKRPYVLVHIEASWMVGVFTPGLRVEIIVRPKAKVEIKRPRFQVRVLDVLLVDEGRLVLHLYASCRPHRLLPAVIGTDPHGDLHCRLATHDEGAALSSLQGHLKWGNEVAVDEHLQYTVFLCSFCHTSCGFCAHDMSVTLHRHARVFHYPAVRESWKSGRAAPGRPRGRGWDDECMNDDSMNTSHNPQGACRTPHHGEMTTPSPP